VTNALLLGAVAALVAANGFFVAAEFALVRARRSRVERLAEEGSGGAGMVLKQLDRIDEYLAACQLGITMASLGIGFLGEPAIARLLEEPLGKVMGHGVAIVVAISVSYLIVTAAHITVGEQVPKIYSIVHPEATSRYAARPLHWFLVFSKPLSWVLNNASNAMLRVVGVSPKDFHEGPRSEEELRMLVSESATGGVLDVGEAEMIHGVFQLHERQAQEVMTRFHTVVTVTTETTVRDALERALTSGHSRLVVVRPGEDVQAVGAVHTNSLVRLLFEAGPDTPVDGVVSPLHVVPETKPLDDLLTDLRQRRSSLALVADEYGTPVGIVTIEDIVEEIVGEIVDENEAEEVPARRLANGDWILRGDLGLAEAQELGIDLTEFANGYTSVGGLVFGTLGRQARRGDTVRLNGFRLKVESVQGPRIAILRVRQDAPALVPPEPQPSA